MNNKLTRYNEDDFFGGNWIKNFFDLPILNSSNVLKTNIRKEGNNYIYDVAVPGYNKEDVNVSYENGYLVVEAKISDSYNHSNSNYIRQERYSGSCSRSFYIGEIDEKKIIARYNNGILSIRVPEETNNQESKIKKINIE